MTIAAIKPPPRPPEELASSTVVTFSVKLFVTASVSGVVFPPPSVICVVPSDGLIGVPSGLRPASEET